MLKIRYLIREVYYYLDIYILEIKIITSFNKYLIYFYRLIKLLNKYL